MAYHLDTSAYDGIQVEILPRSWSHEEFEAFLEDAKRLETSAGEFYWDAIEQPAERDFAGGAIITYLLAVPELNVTYRVDCSSCLPVRKDLSEQCERVARTLHPVGRIVPNPSADRPSPDRLGSPRHATSGWGDPR